MEKLIIFMLITLVFILASIRNIVRRDRLVVKAKITKYHKIAMAINVILIILIAIILKPTYILYPFFISLIIYIVTGLIGQGISRNGFICYESRLAIVSLERFQDTSDAMIEYLGDEIRLNFKGKILRRHITFDFEDREKVKEVLRSHRIEFKEL